MHNIAFANIQNSLIIIKYLLNYVPFSYVSIFSTGKIFLQSVNIFVIIIF